MSGRDARMKALYERGFTLVEIGDKFGITRERVRQILEASEVKRRKTSRSLRACFMCCKKSDDLDDRRCCPGCQGTMSMLMDPSAHPAVIAKASGLSESMIRHRRNKLGIVCHYPNIDRTIPFPTPEDVLDPSASIRELSEKYGVKHSTMSMFRARHGLRKHRKKAWTDQEVSKLVSMMDDGENNVRCAEALGRTVVSVQSKIAHMRKLGEI